MVVLSVSIQSAIAMRLEKKTFDFKFLMLDL